MFNDANGVVLGPLLLTLNIFHTLFYVSIVNFEHVFASLFGILANIYDRAFLQKYLTGKRRRLFSPKITIVDVSQGPKYGSGVIYCFLLVFVFIKHFHGHESRLSSLSSLRRIRLTSTYSRSKRSINSFITDVPII